MEMVQELRTWTSTGMVVETGMDIGLVVVPGMDQA